MGMFELLLTFVFFIALPLWLVFKLYRLLSGYIRSGIERRERLANKIGAYLDRKCLVLDKELEMYAEQMERDRVRAQRRERGKRDGNHTKSDNGTS